MNDLAAGPGPARRAHDYRNEPVRPSSPPPVNHEILMLEGQLVGPIKVDASTIAWQYLVFTGDLQIEGCVAIHLASLPVKLRTAQPDPAPVR